VSWAAAISVFFDSFDSVTCSGPAPFWVRNIIRYHRLLLQSPPVSLHYQVIHALSRSTARALRARGSRYARMDPPIYENCLSALRLVDCSPPSFDLQFQFPCSLAVRRMYLYLSILVYVVSLGFHYGTLPSAILSNIF
jgi:hypothetical protein